METKLPKRKTPHLKNYDYSKSGVYFVTICTENRRQLLSHIVRTDSTAVNETNSLHLVGEGLAPPENDGFEQTISLQNEPTSFANNYKVILTSIGKIAEEQILDLEKRFCNVKVKSYVIMPDHIHILVNLRMESGGASPSPTLNDVVCAFKSLTSRKCKSMFKVEKLFQRSYADHVIRDREDYDKRLKYICENPIRWYYRHKK